MLKVALDGQTYMRLLPVDSELREQFQALIAPSRLFLWGTKA